MFTEQTTAIVNAIGDPEPPTPTDIERLLSEQTEAIVKALNDVTLAADRNTQSLIAALNANTDRIIAAMRQPSEITSQAYFTSTVKLTNYQLVPLEPLFNNLRDATVGGVMLLSFISSILGDDGKFRRDSQIRLRAHFSGFKFRTGYPHATSGPLIFDVDDTSAQDLKVHEVILDFKQGTVFAPRLNYTICAVEDSADANFDMCVNLECEFVY